MPFTIEVTPRADADTQAIFDWLSQHSLAGAARWLNSEQEAVERLAVDALDFPPIAQAKRLKLDVRSRLFGTPRGGGYQLLYLVDVATSHVRVLRVRGPGQRPIRRRDLP